MFFVGFYSDLKSDWWSGEVTGEANKRANKQADELEHSWSQSRILEALQFFITECMALFLCSILLYLYSNIIADILSRCLSR